MEDQREIAGKAEPSQATGGRTGGQAGQGSSDPDLNVVMDAWPTLPLDVRNMVLRLVRLRFKTPK